MATIDPDGNVFPCNTLREPCGNILSAPLADIWKTGPGFRRVRALAEKDLINCAGCENEPFCIRCLGEIKARTGGYIENTCVVCDLAKVWKRADVLWRQNGNG
jgi:radical SAM protein with 4Fe4S-binding SPASM domain